MLLKGTKAAMFRAWTAFMATERDAPSSSGPIFRTRPSDNDRKPVPRNSTKPEFSGKNVDVYEDKPNICRAALTSCGNWTVAIFRRRGLPFRSFAHWDGQRNPRSVQRVSRRCRLSRSAAPTVLAQQPFFVAEPELVTGGGPACSSRS